MKKIIPALAVCALTLAAYPATGHATLLAYESFNTTGNLIGQATSTGFTSSWTQYVSGSGTGTATVYADGLTYSGLLSQGGRAYVVPTGTGATGARASLTSSINSGTLYVSCLLNVDEGLRYFGLALSTSNAAEALVIGHNSGGANWTLSGGAMTGWTKAGTTTTNTNDSGVAYQYDTTTLLLLRIDFNASGASERVRLYVDPSTTASSTDDLTALVDCYTGTSVNLDITGITLAAGYTSGVNTSSLVSFDEIRLGTDLGDVLVVPEVGSCSLAVAGLGFVAFLRRRNRR
ncbi:MAG: hypothetical protein B9S32_10035 [Verrucomicrobia bacterium Tous-C9LFEB]|nr:MAG: hypothetical protein B9S32_10035 [Verrucomicrobia bacterium Tous-C9LFEB]